MMVMMDKVQNYMHSDRMIQSSGSMVLQLKHVFAQRSPWLILLILLMRFAGDDMLQDYMVDAQVRA
jgi:hypothetical protein